jgi:mannose-6-phosphate isomerase
MAEQAMDLARVIRAVFGWKPAGFRAGEKDAIFLGDPIMHLFEAVLAWFELTGHDVWRAWAEDLSDLFLGRMYNSTTGTIPEVFDETWGVHDSPSGSLLAPGHHFEWAWLAERWGRLSGDPRARPAAEALFASGEAGVEAESGLVVDLVFSDLSVCRRSSRLWPQTERLKAALILASLAGAESRYLVSVKSAAETIEGYLDTPMPGLWRDTAEHTGPEAQAPAPASSFYHIVGAIAALDEANRSLTGPVRMAGAAAGLASHGRRA